MGRNRRFCGTYELPRTDLRLPNIRQMARQMMARGFPFMAFEGQPELTAVALLEKPCRFGGSRFFFRCSRCGRRVLTIYWPETLRPGCRVCLHLVYRTQRASRDVLTTGQLRIQALWRRVDPNWTYGDEEPSKPPRMRWGTWERLCAAVGWWQAWIDERWLPRALARLGRRVSLRLVLLLRLRPEGKVSYDYFE